MDGDNVSTKGLLVLHRGRLYYSLILSLQSDPQIVSDRTVYPRRSIIKVVVSKNNQDGVFSLLSLDKDSIATEELQGLHGIV